MNPTNAPALDAASTIMGEHLLERGRQQPQRTSSPNHWLAYLLFGVLLAGVWYASRLQLFPATSDLGYWIGVVGGTMMILLFAYPLRKRWPALAGLGKTKHWFVVHMVLGILGPLLVLAHSNFQIGSVNAGVALFSMLLVAISGVAGRFIYLRIHRGLGGERMSFEMLRKTLGLTEESVRSELHFAPKAEARLRAMAAHAGKPGDSWGEHLHHLTVLPWQIRREKQLCWRDTKSALARQGRERGWDTAKLQDRAGVARQLLDNYTTAVLRVAQLAAYTRMFSLWHVAHVPFVFLMVLCAIVHVVAVHAY